MVMWFFSPGPTPQFDPVKSRYDLKTYLGRLQECYVNIDPRMMMCGSAYIGSQQKLIEDFRATGKLPTGMTDEDLWHARKVTGSCVNPGTNTIIAPCFRFAAFMPVNCFINPVMIMPSVIKSPARTIAIHWFNQTYNCAVNYSNRAGDDQPVSVIATSYTGAVTVSLAAALGATFFLGSINATSPAATIVRCLLPYSACAFAGSANVALMRRKEWQVEGVNLVDEDGKVHGKSLLAGQAAIQKCMWSRVLWNIPPLVIPPILMYPALKLSFIAKNPKVAALLEFSLVTTGLLLGVPPALALFEEHATITPSEIEPQYHNAVRENGEPVKEFTYYKGL